CTSQKNSRRTRRERKVILATTFTVILFMSVVSAMSWLMLLLVHSIGRCKLPHALFVGMMVIFVVPIKFPYLKLVDPDPHHTFRPEFVTIASIWITMALILMLGMLL